jgi:hypothetical protein
VLASFHLRGLRSDLLQESGMGPPYSQRTVKVGDDDLNQNGY